MSGHVGTSALRAAEFSGLTLLLALSSVLCSGAASGETLPEPPAPLRQATTPSKLPASGTVAFPTGTPVEVAFKAAPKEPVVWERLDEYPARLHSAMAGDVASAAVVGRLLTYCATVRGVPFSTNNTRTFKPIAQDTSAEPRVAEVRKFCQQRPTEELASGVEWLKASAASGDARSMKELARVYRPGSDEHLDVLNALWRQGSVMALHRLANAHFVRHYGSSPSSEDAVKALASAWLYTKLNESAFREEPGSSNFVEALNKDLTRRFDNATPEIRAQAIATAREMLSASEGCCSFP
jgi:hypothetical protein